MNWGEPVVYCSGCRRQSRWTHGGVALSQAHLESTKAQSIARSSTSGMPRVHVIAPEPPVPAARYPRGAVRVIALMNQKGGVGKTTTCVNLGAALAHMGQRVLLIDLDPQAHLSLHLGVEPDSLQKSMYHLLVDPMTTAAEILQRTESAVDLLPAQVSLAGVESELADRVVTGAAQTVLRQKIMALLSQASLPDRNVVVRDQEPRGDFCPTQPDGLEGEVRTPESTTVNTAAAYDYVMIDCPPSLGLLTINALTFAQEVIVPMQAHFLALQGLGKLLETIMMLRQGVNHDLRVSGVVLCMHEKQTILAGEVIADLQKFLESARGTDVPWCDAVVLAPPIRRNIKLAESPSFGRSIFEYAPECHGALDYGRLAKSVMSHAVAASH